MLSEGLPTAKHQRPCSIAAETAGLAGWLTWDLDHTEAAGSYFKSGMEAAREAGDKALGDYLVGSAACQPAFKESPLARLRQLEGTTFGFIKTDATPATRAWLGTLEAEAHALAGDGAAAMRALDQAEIDLEHQDAKSDTRPRAEFFDEAYLVGERGMTLSRLGDARPAQEALEHALATLDETMVKSRPRLISALARAHVAEGNVDEACRLGAEALVTVRQLQVEPNLGAVLELRRDLEPWSDSPQVRQLDEQLATV